MIKFLFLVAPLFLLLSCYCQKADCSACEEKLKSVLTNMTNPLDLPESETPDTSFSTQGQITAIILENNRYSFEEDTREYDFEEYKDLLSEKMTQSSEKITEVKIAGHKFAHYEAVFKVLAFCQANELDPILAYDK